LIAGSQARAFSSEVVPVRVKKTRQNKNLEPRFDSIETEKAPGLGTVIPGRAKREPGTTSEPVSQ
jgi:hypothetical protein